METEERSYKREYFSPLSPPCKQKVMSKNTNKHDEDCCLRWELVRLRVERGGKPYILKDFSRN